MKIIGIMKKVETSISDGQKFVFYNNYEFLRQRGYYINSVKLYYNNIINFTSSLKKKLLLL